VWFHKCPSKGKSCNNSKLHEQGGCAIWYDEPTFWKDINTRLKITVPKLDSNFKPPSSFQSNISFGQKREGGDDWVFKGHEKQIQPLVAELNQLENIAQHNYWLLRNKWTKTHK